MYCLFCDKMFHSKSDRDLHIAVDHWKIKLSTKIKKVPTKDRVVRVRLF